MIEELGMLIELDKQHDAELETAKRLFKDAKDKREHEIKSLADNYFRVLINELDNGKIYSQLLETDGLFRLLDSMLSRHNEYDLELGEDRGHWRIGDFGFDGSEPTLFERYPAIKKQLETLSEKNAKDVPVLVQSRYGCYPWKELGNFRSGREIAGLIRNINPLVHEIKKATREGLIDLLTATVTFDSDDGYAGSGSHRFRIIDTRTDEQLCPNTEFIHSITKLRNWYRTCSKVIGNPLGIIVKKDAKKGYKVLGTGRDY